MADIEPTNGAGHAEPEEQVAEGIVQVLHADPASLQAHRSFLRKGLSIILKNTKHKVYWLPEHVIHAVAQARADLWWVVKDEILVGFVVSQVTTDPFVNLPLGLFLWMCYAEPGHHIVELTDAFLEQYARSSGLLYEEALTALPDFLKLAGSGLPARWKGFGWYPAMVIVRKDLVEKEEG